MRSIKLLIQCKLYKQLLMMLFVLFMFSSNQMQAQEFKCNISVIAPQVQLSNKQILESLQNDIKKFMTTYKFTKEQYQETEKIEITILITASSISNNVFSGTMQITASRPVYGSGYNTSTLNVLDKNIQFTYVEFQPLEYVDGVYTSDLTSILAYYAYIVLGVDYDSFIELGGNDYFSKASSIVNSAQTATIAGWKSDLKSDRNRNALITEFTDERYKAFRKAWYNYHRKGFDVMKDDVEAGRTEVAKAIESLQPVYKNNPFSYLMSMFFLCKKDEIINLFNQAPSSEKAKISSLCQEMDVTNANKYQDKLRP